MTKTRLPALLPALLLALSSCATVIGGAVGPDGGADFDVHAALEPRIAALVSAFAAAAGIAPGTPILDGPAIAASMADAPGVVSVTLRNTTPVSLAGNIGVSHLGLLLTSGEAGFAVFEQTEAGGRFAVTLDRVSARAMLEMISPEITAYLAALMAPVATGEVMTRAAYLQLVGAVYGAAIAEEIAGAAIRAWFDFPAPVVSVAGGTFTGRRAEFSIPLVDLLVLETPLRYEVVW